MVNWIVLIRTQDGIQNVTVDADLVDSSEDENYIEFSNVKSMDESLEWLVKISREESVDEQKKMFFELVKALGKIRIAIFLKSMVLGYYQAEKEGGNMQ